MMPSVSQSGQIALTSSGVSTLTRDADRPRDAGVVHVLVPAIPGPREADVGDLAEADILSGLGLERLVEADRVFVDLADRVGEVEERQQPGRMPGRARGQLLPLDENDVGPALPGEVIERRRRRRRRRRSRQRGHGFSWFGPSSPGSDRLSVQAPRHACVAATATVGCTSSLLRVLTRLSAFEPRRRDRRPTIRPPHKSNFLAIFLIC